MAGNPSRIAAVGSSRRRSTTALVKCVVPIITAAISSVAVPELSSTWRNAVVMPRVTSSVVGVLILAMTSVPAMSTASVFVPPTSIPIRGLIGSVPPCPVRPARLGSSPQTVRVRRGVAQGVYSISPTRPSHPR